MKNKLSQNVTYWLGVVAIGLVVGLSLQFVRAWTEPAVAPPGGNIGAPVNTGDIGQWKLGNLALNTNGTYANGLIVANGNVGIGTADPGQKLDVAGTVKTQKIQLGGKWLFSGVGDAHGNDEWLRMFNKDGTGYYGGIAADKFWAGSQICLSGDCRTSWPAGGGKQYITIGECDDREGRYCSYFGCREIFRSELASNAICSCECPPGSF